MSAARAFATIRADVNPTEGRPYGLYGNSFARASANVVRRAARAIEPPTITNLVAMAAPSCGYGRYSERDITGVLRTAFTGFRAAVLESAGCDVAIHTGYWGCGAFGGNRTLMALLQLLVAAAAGVGLLVFHGVDTPGSAPYRRALHLLEREFGEEEVATEEPLRRVVALGFEWGESDGN